MLSRTELSNDVLDWGELVLMLSRTELSNDVLDWGELVLMLSRTVLSSTQSSPGQHSAPDSVQSSFFL